MEPISLRRTQRRLLQLPASTPGSRDSPPFTLVERVAAGTFGTVHKASIGDKLVAVKQINGEWNPREAAICKLLNEKEHPNLVRPINDRLKTEEIICAHTRGRMSRSGGEGGGAAPKCAVGKMPFAYVRKRHRAMRLVFCACAGTHDAVRYRRLGTAESRKNSV